MIVDIQINSMSSGDTDSLWQPSVRYSTAQETLYIAIIPTYVGLMLHDHTCMAVLICMYTQNIIRQQNIH